MQCNQCSVDLTGLPWYWESHGLLACRLGHIPIPLRPEIKEGQMLVTNHPDHQGPNEQKWYAVPMPSGWVGVMERDERITLPLSLFLPEADDELPTT